MFGRMFSAGFIRQYLTILLRIVFWPIRLAALLLEYHVSDECGPLRSNEEILNFHRYPAKWTSLVERLAQRCAPRLLGDHFEELRLTTNGSVSEETRPKVLVCHDLAGNYRGDRHITGSSKWDDYRFYHWSGIDYFCYFSHQYVTIPTLQWINAAHKNGVRVLGTMIVESNSQNLLNDILKSDDYMRSIASSLALIAKHCKFEGWFLNIECSLPQKSIESLKNFVAYLTEYVHKEVANGEVFWYDSIIDSGFLSWQNELNKKNKMFFDVCDGILINYTWNERNLKNSAAILADDPKLMTKVFIGLDVFGRGQVAKFQSNLTIAKIKEYNFSVGIFAPGWTFEGTQEFGINIATPNGNELCNKHFIERNDLFWSMLWRHFYTFGPTQLPFNTSFCIGSGKQKFRDGFRSSTDPWFNLSDQSWQPSVPVRTMQRHFDDSFTGGSSIRVLPTNMAKRLFVCDFACDQDVILSFAYKKDILEELQIVLLVNDVISGKHCKIICGERINSVKNVEPVQFCQPLRDQDLQRIVRHLGQNRNKVLPIFENSSGWETRYFYLRFGNNVQAKINDIGVVTVHEKGGEVSRGTLLGALNIYQGMTNNDFAVIPWLHAD